MTYLLAAVEGLAHYTLLEVLRNRALQSDIYLLTYLLHNTYSTQNN